MLTNILSFALLMNPVLAEELKADETIVVTGERIPEAKYQLKLEFMIYSSLIIVFHLDLNIVSIERTQPVVAITSVIDRGSEYDQEDVDGIAHVLEHLAFRAIMVVLKSV